MSTAILTIFSKTICLSVSGSGLSSLSLSSALISKPSLFMILLVSSPPSAGGSADFLLSRSGLGGGAFFVGWSGWSPVISCCASTELVGLGLSGSCSSSTVGSNTAGGTKLVSVPFSITSISIILIMLG